MAKKIGRAIGSLQPDVDRLLEWNDLTAADFAPLTEAERTEGAQHRKSVSYWADAWRRLRKNTVAMVTLGVIGLLILFAFVGPVVVPYEYNQFNRGAENLQPWHTGLEDQARISAELAARTGGSAGDVDEVVAEAIAQAEAAGKPLTSVEIAIVRAKAVEASKSGAAGGEVTEASIRAELGIKTKFFGYSNAELQRIADGESVFPHVFGTDKFGRDSMVRVMIATRLSMLVGVAAALLVLVIGATYGSISGFFGGRVDVVMQRFVEIIYAVPEVLVILLMSSMLREPIEAFMGRGGNLSGFAIVLGPNLISMFLAFAMLYWVGMSRIIRGQVLQIKQQEYVTAARALGASSGRIIRSHLLPNCIGQLVVTTCLQIPSAIFLESFLSYLGVGVSAPMISLGSMAAEAMDGVYTYTSRLIIPAFILSLMILSFNLFGDGLRDALDPRLKK